MSTGEPDKTPMDILRAWRDSVPARPLVQGDFTIRENIGDTLGKIPDMTISEFCRAHKADDQDEEWALANCQTMHEVWSTAEPELLLWVATRCGVLSHRDCVRIAYQATKHVEHVMPDPSWFGYSLNLVNQWTMGEDISEEIPEANHACNLCDLITRCLASTVAAINYPFAAATHAESAIKYAAAAAGRTPHTAGSELDASQAHLATWIRANTVPNFTKEAREEMIRTYLRKSK
jgi:hypothetical protein